MGNGNSKASESPKPTEPVNVMITKEVMERWETYHFQSQQQRREDNYSPNLESVSGSTPSDASNCNTTINVEADTSQAEECILEIEESSLPDSDISSTNEIQQQDPPATSEIDAGAETDEILSSNDDKMDKFANFFVPRDSSKLRLSLDLENGKGIQEDHHHPMDFFLRYPAGAEEDDYAMFEEVDETADSKKKRVDPDLEGYIDEEAEIGNFQYKSQSLKEVHVPRPALPVVIDQDEEGKVTIETIKAWQMKQRLEEELSQHNAQWSGALQRITATIEDETQAKAEDLQKRIYEFKKEYGEFFEPPEAPCNALVSQVGKCYEKNERQVLKCSDLVRQFAQCTNKIV